MSQKITLLEAIDLEHTEEVKKKLANPKTNVNFTDNHNFSAIHHAVRKRNLEIIELLLSREDLLVNIKSYEGYTPLHLACKASDIPIEIVELLIKKDSSQVNCSNNEQESPLHSSCFRRRLDIVKLLIENGADANSVDLENETCLHYAASISYYDMIEYLLNNTSVDPKAKNIYGMNALCTMIVRNSFDYNEQVFRSGCILVEKSYDLDPVTKEYNIEDTFQPTFLASCYCQYLCEYFLHVFYSKNNSFYRLMQELEESIFEDITFSEFRYYIYSFLHERVSRSSIEKIHRFEEVNSVMIHRSYHVFLKKSLISDKENKLVLRLLEHLNSIGFNPVYEEQLADEIGSDFLPSVARQLTSIDQYKRLFKVIEYFSQKEFNINIILEKFLEVSFQENSDEIITRIFYLLAPFITDFFLSCHSLNDVAKFKEDLFKNIVQNFGERDTYLSLAHSLEVFSLKHICRNVIRRKFLKESKSNQEFFAKLNSLSTELPRNMLNYLKFDFTSEIFNLT